MSQEDFDCYIYWWKDFGSLSLQEDFLSGGKCPGRILGVYYCGRMLYREANVLGGFWMFLIVGGFCTGRILYWDANVPGGFCMFHGWEDFVPAWEDFVLHPVGTLAW